MATSAEYGGDLDKEIETSHGCDGGGNGEIEGRKLEMWERFTNNAGETHIEEATEE